jgi:hypothetical protein
MPNDHIEPLRLLDLACADEATDKETKHLRECEQCQDVFEALARQLNKQQRVFND